VSEALYDTLFPEVLIHAPNCPEPTVITSIRDAVYEFCTETMWLTAEIDPIDVEANESDYEIPTPRAGYEVVEVTGPLWWGTRKLMRRNEDELDQLYGVNWRVLGSQFPETYVMRSPSTFTLVPTPTIDAPEIITGRVAVAPSLTSTRADSDLLRIHRVGLAHGALAKIYSIPDQPYTHEDKALLFGRLFNSAKGKAAARVRSGYSNAPARVVPPKFW
jgi:hypothetical protein